MKVEKVIGYAVSVSSTGEQYTITGNVNVEGNSLQNISSAVVKKTDTQEEVADFSWYGNLSVSFRVEMSDTESCSLVKDVKEYIGKAKAGAESGVFNPSTSEGEEA